MIRVLSFTNSPLTVDSNDGVTGQHDVNEAVSYESTKLDTD